jgi:hypothetical protein
VQAGPDTYVNKKIYAIRLSVKKNQILVNLT